MLKDLGFGEHEFQATKSFQLVKILRQIGWAFSQWGEGQTTHIYEAIITFLCSFINGDCSTKPWNRQEHFDSFISPK